MHALVDHLRDLARNTLGTGPESPLDPGVARRSAALGALADLLEDEPGLVRPAVRRTIEEHVFEPLPEQVTPPLGAHGAEVLARHGWDGPVGVADHLRVIDLLAGAVVHDAWEMAEAAGCLLVGGGTVGELAATVGLHGFEVELALTGVAPDPEYFLRRPALSESERRAALAALVGQDV